MVKGEFQYRLGVSAKTMIDVVGERLGSVGEVEGSCTFIFTPVMNLDATRPRIHG